VAELNKRHNNDHIAAYDMFMTGEIVGFEKLMAKVKKRNILTVENIAVINQGFDDFCKKTLEMFESFDGANFTRDDIKKEIPNNFWVLMSYK